MRRLVSRLPGGHRPLRGGRFRQSAQQVVDSQDQTDRDSAQGHPAGAKSLVQPAAGDSWQHHHQDRRDDDRNPAICLGNRVQLGIGRWRLHATRSRGRLPGRRWLARKSSTSRSGHVHARQCGRPSALLVGQDSNLAQPLTVVNQPQAAIRVFFHKVLGRYVSLLWSAFCGKCARTVRSGG